MSAGDRFLRRLFDEMERRYRVEREEWRAELREKYGAPVLFVHELVECPKKREMRLRFPEIELASTYNPRFVVGWLIEEGVRRVLGVGEDQRRWERLVETQDLRAVVAGSIDARDPETGRPIEIKYLTSLYNAPHEHHELQLSIYLWGVGEPEGELWMISPEGAIFLPVSAASDEAVIQLVSNALRAERAPMWQWECDHCQFEKFCPSSASRRRGGGRE